MFELTDKEVSRLIELMREKMIKDCHKKFNELYGFNLSYEQYDNMVNGLMKLENTPLNFNESFKRVEEECSPIPNNKPAYNIDTLKFIMKVFNQENLETSNKQHLEDKNMYYWFYKQLDDSKTLQESIRGKSELFVYNMMIKMWNERK